MTSNQLTVGVGASAADTRALETFLSRLVVDDRLAVVLVLQDREALDEDSFRRRLREAGRELVVVAHGMPLEAGRIYLPPPEALLTIDGEAFDLRPVAEGPDERGTIDSFLVSLARNEDGHAIAVVFDGLRSEGTLGFTAIKEIGGLTLAEKPAEAEAATLEASGRPIALADFLLAPDDLAERVNGYARRLSAAATEMAEQETAQETRGHLAAIASILRAKTGHDFHGYKTGTFLRRIQRRMQVAQSEDLASYVETLRTQPDEAQNLFNDLLIGVTQFFRDRKEFELLEAQVVPKLFAGKTRNDHVRIWVIGCSTGEEAYSLAILLREYMGALEEPPHVQIFASDLDGRALASARAGRFASDIARDVSPTRLARWFVREGNTFCVSKEIREMCIFSQHSVIKDAPFSKLDLISCRNLLIYLDAQLQDRVIPLFHFALNPGGYLFLGNSENASRHAGLFAPVEPRFRIFRRLETHLRVLPDFPFVAAERRSLDSPPQERRSNATQISLARTAERFVERFTPAFAIVDGDFNVLHFSGRIGRFIEPSGGAASLNILNLAHTDLRLDLRMALTQARDQGKAVQVNNLRIADDDHPQAVQLVVEPVQDGQPAGRHFIVLFKEDVPFHGSGDRNGEPGLIEQDERVQRLEAELRLANERLQATIEELESTNEELKSSNEEYQSLNEELQSANEELETSKEELQSINEELTTVNGELGHRVQELGRTNSDLKNLLESTQIATVFLDNDLRVMNFTPAVTEIFHLVETDIGRPIAHIKSRVAYDDLQGDVRRVLRSLGSADREIESTTGVRYMARVLPYRSVDNFIGGVVVTFTNITPLTRAQQALQDSEKRLRTLTEGIPQLVWRAAGDGGWTWSSMQWTAHTGLSEEESRGFGWLKAVHPDDREAAKAAWVQASGGGQLEMEARLFRAARGDYRWFHTRAMPVLGNEGEVVEWLGTSTDIDEMRQLQEQQNVLVAELQHRTRNLIGVVRSMADRTASTAGSLDQFLELYHERLGALARVNSLLSQLKKGQRITFDALIRGELGARGALDPSAGRSVVLDGPTDVPLRSATVQTFALAIHELATNASKYGALADPKGRLEVRWRLEDGKGEEWLHVDWRESGVERMPAPGDLPHGTGYGRELIEKALPYQLKARTTYELGADGVHCTISLPTQG